MNRSIMLALLVAALGVAGCDDQKAAPTASGGQAASQIKDDDIPTVADFNDESAKEISTTNYKAEADALEKEISAE